MSLLAKLNISEKYFFSLRQFFHIHKYKKRFYLYDKRPKKEKIGEQIKFSLYLYGKGCGKQDKDSLQLHYKTNLKGM